MSDSSADQENSKRKRDDEDDSPIKQKNKKQKLDQDKKYRVLVFFDLGCRKGCAFDPKLFCEFSESKWACIEEIFDNKRGEFVLHSTEIEMECDISREDVKWVLKERERPQEYILKRHLIAEDFGQELGEESSSFVLHL